MDRDSGAGLRVFGVVSPSIRDPFTDDVSRFQRDGGITVPIEALRAFLANSEAPRLIIALDQEKDGVVGGLRSSRSNGRLLGLR